jgi:hypothetical protein
MLLTAVFCVRGIGQKIWRQRGIECLSVNWEARWRGGFAGVACPGAEAQTQRFCSRLFLNAGRIRVAFRATPVDDTNTRCSRVQSFMTMPGSRGAYSHPMDTLRFRP